MNFFGKKIKLLAVSLLTLMLTACGSTPQPVVKIDKNYFNNDDLKIGIVYLPPEEKATTHIFGAGCLLCYGVASALTSSLDSHLKNSIDTDELTAMKNLVIAEYSQLSKNVELVNLPTPIDKLKKFKGELGYAKKDFRALKDELNLDMLVVFQVSRFGAYRSFSNYVPNGDPQGYVSGYLYSVDLSDNAYVQYLELNEMVQPQGEWDEAPNYPSVTTSYYQAVENTKQKIRESI